MCNLFWTVTKHRTLPYQDNIINFTKESLYPKYPKDKTDKNIKNNKKTTKKLSIFKISLKEKILIKKIFLEEY
uniref:Uncharacterized protein n=1 Tax=Heterorhabditis bacteriophora TaxID=37862 RepID=A0A1I7WDB5_HETBA